jgi:hypothetical protein
MAASGPGTGKRTEEQRRDLPSEAQLFINAVPSILIGLDSEGRI